MRLQAGQQVIGQHVRVALAGLAALAAASEQRVGLVEQDDDVGGLGVIEQGAEILLGLADIFVHHRRQVAAIERRAERAAFWLVADLGLSGRSWSQLE